MDFGLLSHKQSATPEPTYENFDGSLKRERSGLLDDDGLRFYKMPNKLCESDLKAKKCGESFASSGRSNNVVWPSLSVDGQKMLCFASSDQPPQYFGNDSSSRSIAFSISQDERRGGGILSDATRGPFSRTKSPFTPSQWMELQNQAWIYKYLASNAPVPQSLLLPLSGTIYSQRSPGCFPPNLFGWDMPFRLGLLGSNDPEPLRCRRTDGKKWRCSREAVPDQKYCERHINRGRHRSRKHVEATQSNGHVIGGSSIATVDASIAPFDPSLKFAPMVISNGGGSNGLGALETLAPSIGLKPKEFTFGGWSHMDFGLVSSDSLLSPSQRISSYTTNSATANLNPYWQEGPKYDWTQLSMSIPNSSSVQHGPSSVHADRALLEPVHEKNGSGYPAIGGPLGEAMLIGGSVLYESSSGS